MQAVGLASKGVDTINGKGITKTCVGWVASPLAGMLVSMILHSCTIKAVLQADNKKRRALQARPVYIALTVGIAVSLILIKGPPSARIKPVWAAALISLAIGVGCGILDTLYRYLKVCSTKHKVGAADTGRLVEQGGGTIAATTPGGTAIAAATAGTTMSGSPPGTPRTVARKARNRSRTPAPFQFRLPILLSDDSSGLDAADGAKVGKLSNYPGTDPGSTTEHSESELEEGDETVTSAIDPARTSTSTSTSMARETSSQGRLPPINAATHRDADSNADTGQDTGQDTGTPAPTDTDTTQGGDANSRLAPSDNNSVANFVGRVDSAADGANLDMIEDAEMDAEQVLALEEAEKTFVPLLILSAVSVAFAHGANDLGNAVGPLASM